MWNKIKSAALYVLVAVCFGSLIFNVIGGGSRGKIIKVSYWGTKLPYKDALEEGARRYNAFQSEYAVVVSQEDAGNYRT